MVRESGISATRPIFPNYLLSSFKIPFTRRRSSGSASSAYGSPPSAVTTPSNSPPTAHDQLKSTKRLSQARPDTLRCLECSVDIAFTSQIISKGFTGRYGRAFLVGSAEAEASLLNIRTGRNDNRQLVTGWHTVADISCACCQSKLGWKYVDAKEMSQKYKVGKYILETERVMTHRRWEDVDVPETLEEGTRDGDEVEFDSEDEDECEDIFAGTWDAETVRRRRESMPPRRVEEDGR